MEKLFAATQYLKYRISAGTPHDVHSPFVYNLLNSVIRDQAPYYVYEKIEALRSQATQNEKLIEVMDYGSGGESCHNRKLKVSFIASNFVKPKKYGQLLFRLANHFYPKTILEVGTSLGISTLYLASPHSDSRVFTLEGCPRTAAIAQQHFETLGAVNIRLVKGEFSSTLPGLLEKCGPLDLVYFDGNHRENPTLDYFNQCLKRQHEESIFIFDDIHSSKGMEEAWNKIRNHPLVHLSIDLFELGLVFFRTDMPPQHFTLRF